MKQEKAYYMKAANGLVVRIPESRLESWKKAQDEIRAGKKAPEQSVKKLTSIISSELEKVAR